MKREITELENKINEKREKNKLREEIDKNKIKKKKLEAEIKKLNDTKLNDDDELERLRKKIENLTTNVSEKENKNQEVIEEIEKYNEEIRKLRSQNNG